MAIEKKNSPVRSCFCESHSPVYLQTLLLPSLFALDTVYAPTTPFWNMVSNHRAEAPATFCLCPGTVHLSRRSHLEITIMSAVPRPFPVSGRMGLCNLLHHTHLRLWKTRESIPVIVKLMQDGVGIHTESGALA